jgi:hypothetical protein
MLTKRPPDLGGLFYSVKEAAKAWIIPAASAAAEVES